MKHFERYFVEMYDDFDEPTHQQIKSAWTNSKYEAHKMAIKYIGFDHLKYANVCDTKTNKHTQYSWFDCELCKKEY